MTQRKQPQELIVLGSFGNDAASARVLAVQPDEWTEEAHRTFLLGLRGSALEIVDTLDRPLRHGWTSAAGVTYAPSNAGQIACHADGAWRFERVCEPFEMEQWSSGPLPTDVIFQDVLGFSGATPAQDRLMVSTGLRLFTGSCQDGFSEIEMPEEADMIMAMHGLTPNQIYLCTEMGPLLWDGTALSPFQFSEDDELSDILVVSPEEILGLGDGAAYRWTPPSGWHRLRSELKSFGAGWCRFRDQVFVPSREGVARLEGDTLKRISTWPCNRLTVCGDTLLAAGLDGGLSIFNGRDWVRMPLPRLAAGDAV